MQAEQLGRARVRGENAWAWGWDSGGRSGGQDGAASSMAWGQISGRGAEAPRGEMGTGRIQKELELKQFVWGSWASPWRWRGCKEVLRP